ncbi:divergent paired-related homeobox-like [Zalophus californianus]|uniref:Divergent paired-related homeobox-like n=1 Tax=Zalophus californianus TaxID=9704 RepID=A0A6J2E402_ZALCA|nr:divergent paired-related homeobox-like [Zalophus californianus]
MAGAGDLSKGKDQKHSQGKRTMFPEKQLADLEFLFSKNPHPAPSLLKEMASKLEIHPTVLQVWFKNHRAKVRKAKQQQLAGVEVKTSSSKRYTDAAPGAPDGAYPASLVYTDHPIPSFQLSICSNFKALPDHFFGHKIVHFSCCRGPNIYSLCPITESQILSTSFTANSLGSSTPQRT